MTDLEYSATKYLVMKFIETSKEVDQAEKRAFPWIVLGVPIGCGVGVAIRNIGLGVGIGLVIGGTLMALQAKSAKPKVSPITLVALMVACAAMLALGFIARR